MHFEIWNTPMNVVFDDGLDNKDIYYAGAYLGGWSGHRHEALRYFTFKEALLAYEHIQQTSPNPRDRIMRITTKRETRVWPLSPLEQLAEVAR